MTVLIVTTPAGFDHADLMCPDCGMDVRNPDGCNRREPNGAPFHVHRSFHSYRAWYVHSGSLRALHAMSDLITPEVVDALDRVPTVRQPAPARQLPARRPTTPAATLLDALAAGAAHLAIGGGIR